MWQLQEYLVVGTILKTLLRITVRTLCDNCERMGILPKELNGVWKNSTWSSHYKKWHKHTSRLTEYSCWKLIQIASQFHDFIQVCEWFDYDEWPGWLPVDQTLCWECGLAFLIFIKFLTMVLYVFFARFKVDKDIMDTLFGLVVKSG